MVRASLTTMIALVLSASCACAAGISTDAQRSRSGAYVGGQLGAAWGDSNWTVGSESGTAHGSGSLGIGNPFDFASGAGSYFQGVQAGYNYELPSGVVLGVTSDIAFPNMIAGTQSVDVAGQVVTYEDKVLMSGSLRARLGYAFGPLLVYGTGGYSWALEQVTRDAAATGNEETHRPFRDGWSVGAGVETDLGGNWTADLAYLYSDFGAHQVSFADGKSFRSDLTLQTVRAGLNYRLPGTTLEETHSAPLVDPANWAVHGQTTYLIQTDPDFRSPYVGTNSLIPGQSRETWDATFYLGMRLWQGAELWIDPEIDQGFGLSNTLGVAGFPSGEAYKVGQSFPYARMPRYFIRDTIALGGQSEHVDGAANQLEGSITSNRLVLTLGKFAVTDVFDTNSLAHDAHTDFMNWALIDTGSFDYAADAWGYTYGTSVEWYQGAWTLRAGLFDLSKEPNSEVLDPDFSQFQTVAEIEHRHDLFGQPGKIAITGFLSRARMGTYADAVALAEATGQPAEMAPVRRYRSRPGIGVNLEQRLSPSVAVFMRAGTADGQVEPFDFTDIDRTFALGTMVKGTSWGRPKDEFGLAGVVNNITSEHAAFFNAGGLGILVGDGKLPHPGPEQIVETYYQFPVGVLAATLDYQFINNPGYNRDRGPVSVLGARLHTQF